MTNNPNGEVETKVVRQPKSVLAHEIHIDLVLLVLRVAVGTAFFAQGTTKWGWFGGTNPPGMAGIQQFLEILGYNEVTALAWLLTATEITCGLLLIFGLFTPLACAGLIAIAFNGAFGLGWSVGYANGYAGWLVYMAVAAAIAAFGAGRFALDRVGPLKSNLAIQRWLAGSRALITAAMIGVASGVFVLMVPGPGFNSTPNFPEFMEPTPTESPTTVVP